MYNSLYKFHVGNNILYQKQLGFQSARSTEHAILQLVNQTRKAFSQGKYTHKNINIKHRDINIGIFTDLSKTFDTVNHNILLEQLKTWDGLEAIRQIGNMIISTQK